MKTTFSHYFVAITLATAVLFSSCDNTDDPIVDPTETDLQGEITENRTLKSGLTYTLSGGVHVKAGATLTIEPGVKIVAKDDNIVDYILIEQNAKINAEGTSSSPIIMTAENESHGAWGGLHICGNASINVTGGAKSEIGDASYGGNNDADNSGTLKYIRIEYAGYAFTGEKEANGLTLYGVGNETIVEYIQTYKASHDGFEWFGRTVNCKYLVSTDNTDDSFDWTQGWRGNGQYFIAHQISDECDALIEADNNSKNTTLAPISKPILSNLTLIGNNSADNTKGIRLRAGTHAEIRNAIVIGKSGGIVTETPETENSLLNGISILDNIHLSSNLVSKENIYSETKFLENPNNKVGQTFSLDGYIGSVASGSSFIGAVKDVDNDWTKGWVRK